MSKRKNRGKKLRKPELGVIQPALEVEKEKEAEAVKDADPFDSLVHDSPEPEAKTEIKEPVSIASFLSAFAFKTPPVTREAAKIEQEPKEKAEDTLAAKEEDREEAEPEKVAEAEPGEVEETGEVREDDEVHEVHEPQEPQEPHESREVHDDSIIIELKKLTRRYGYGDATSFALKDFDLTIKRGEFIMIMGPSGCGKTTLLNIIGLLDRATSGEYILNGEDVSRISHRRQSRLRAKKIGFIFQNFNLINSLSIIENVALPLVYVGRSKTSRLKTASDVLKRFHLGEREYYLPNQLSGGQQQRAAIARAIVSDPEIILADEPTGNLDSRSSSIVMDELKQIHEEGNTIIMVTHNPSLTAYATRVIHMLDGQIDTDIKTVADHNLPQPIEIKRRRRRKFRGRREEV